MRNDERLIITRCVRRVVDETPSDQISDERLDVLIAWAGDVNPAQLDWVQSHWAALRRALVELRARRAAAHEEQRG